MKSNVKGYKQKRRYENRIKRIEKLHLKTLEDWSKFHNDWYCINVLLSKELEQEKRDRKALIKGAILSILFVLFVFLLNKF